VEGWVVAEDTPAGWEPFRNPQFDNTISDKFPRGFIPPLNRSADGRVIWSVLPGNAGEAGVYGMADGDEPHEDGAWTDFVQRHAGYVRDVVADTRENVLSEVADALYFEIGVARERELGENL